MTDAVKTCANHGILCKTFANHKILCKTCVNHGILRKTRAKYRIRCKTYANHTILCKTCANHRINNTIPDFTGLGGFRLADGIRPYKPRCSGPGFPFPITPYLPERAAQSRRTMPLSWARWIGGGMMPRPSQARRIRPAPP